MNQFDALKEKWQQQNPVESKWDIETIRKKAFDQVVKYQRKMILSNFLMSASFAITIGVLVWIWNAYQERSAYFYAGLMMVVVLLIVFAVIQWLGVQYKNIKPELNPKDFIFYSRKKLFYNRFTIKYALPAYFILLTAALIIYYADVLPHAELAFQLGAYGITLAYIGIMSVFAYKKAKKKIAHINKLLTDLEEWEEMIMDEP